MFNWVYNRITALMGAADLLVLNNIEASALVKIASESISELTDEQRNNVEWCKNNWIYDSRKEANTLIETVISLTHKGSAVWTKKSIKEYIETKLEPEDIVIHNSVGEKSRELLREYKKLMGYKNRSEVLFGLGMQAGVKEIWSYNSRNILMCIDSDNLSIDVKYNVLKMLSYASDVISIDDVRINKEEYEFHKSHMFDYCKFNTFNLGYKKLQKIFICIEMKKAREELDDIPKICLNYYKGEDKSYYTESAIARAFNKVYDTYAYKITEKQIEKYRILVG